jgi:hypothetical protein
VSLIGLITEAEYQIRMWTSLAALSDQPGDRELQESFWRLVSQKKDPAGLMPKPDESASLPGLDKLNDVWKFTKNCSQAQVEVWKERQADCKSALQQAQAPLNDVWDQWSRLEIGQWQYLQIRTKNLV